MEQKTLDDATMTQYLLGLLSEEERSRIEESFFESDTYFEQLTSFEDDLIDAYVNGGLSVNIRKAFENKLNSDPHWKQRVVFAKALARRIAEPESRAIAPARSTGFFQVLLNAFRSQGGMFQFAMAGASLLVVLGVVALTWQVLQQRSNLQRAQGERQNLQTAVDELKGQVAGLQKQDESLSRELEQERGKRQELESQRPTAGNAVGLMATFLLRSGLVRGNDDAPRLTIPPATRTVRFQLELNPADDYPNYRAELRTAKGITVLTRDMLKAQGNANGKTITFDLAAQSLAAGPYELALLGHPEPGKSEEIAYYYFNVQ